MDHGRRSFFGRPALAALLFGLGLAVFAPPLLGIPARAGGAALWLYLFAAWASLIAVLIPAALARGPEPRPPDPPAPRGRG